MLYYYLYILNPCLHVEWPVVPFVLPRYTQKYEKCVRQTYMFVTTET